MEAARPEEGEPPAGSFALKIRTLTGGITTLRDVVSSQTVGSVTVRLCVETSGEPTLTRLLYEQRPLADRKRSLEQYGIVRDAELHASPLLPGNALTTSCVAEADSRISAAVEACATPAVLKLRRANGKHKHRRWAHLERQGDDVILAWAQHEDGSEQWQWKSFGSVPPKRRTVTGVREDMLPPGHANGHGLGLAVETVERDDVLFVAETAGQRTKWLSALREVVGAAALRKAVAAEANVDALVVAGCRSVEEVAALGVVDAAAVSGLPAEAAKAVEFVASPLRLPYLELVKMLSHQTLAALLLAGYDTAAHVWGLSDEAVAALAGAAVKEVAAWRQAQWRWARAHDTIDITGEGGALATTKKFMYWRSAVCGEVLQAEGEAYAEFTWVRGDSLKVGVARAGVDPSSVRGGFDSTADGWMNFCNRWIKPGGTVGLLLRRGSLSAHIGGRQVGVMCTGLSGALVWAADLFWGGSSVRIARKPPPA